MSDTDAITAKKRKKSKKKSNKISFDEEIVPKGAVQKLKSKKSQTNTDNVDTQSKNKKIVQENGSVEEPLQTDADIRPSKKPKRKKNKEANLVPEQAIPPESSNQTETEETVSLDPVNPKIKKEESIRARKRKKHEQLLLAKKSKVDLAMQEKCLNYLSQWKHNRSDWKFEKLRQIWLQQYMFDCDRIPDQFWEILVEYFSNSKGLIRKTITDDALKLIEKSESIIISQTKDEEGEAKAEDEEHVKANEIKIERAKSIMQSFQE